MQLPFTVEQVTTLAPDDASLKAGRGLTNPGKWPTLGISTEALWGECQGSGSKPYQVSVDLGSTAFKCTCPSRKFPCKHGLGLLLLALAKPAAVTEGSPPAWVADWLISRKDKAEKKAQAAAEKKDQPPPDPAVAAKRVAKRLDRMKEGGEELGRWLADQLRNGISGMPQQSASYWQGVAARMVDSQVPGLGVEVQRLEGLAHSGEGWPGRVLTQLGRMHLLCEGLKRFEELPAPLQGDLRASLGWAVEKEELTVSGEKVEDDWCVVGQSFEERDRLWERRTWLQGRGASRMALVLDFSHGNRNFAVPLMPRAIYRASLVFYPSAYPLRAVLLPESLATRHGDFLAVGETQFSMVEKTIGEAVAANPWLSVFPLVLDGVTPMRRETGWLLRDGEGREWPFRPSELEGWELLSLSCGRPISLFGEWQFGVVKVLSCWMAGEFHAFT